MVVATKSLLRQNYVYVTTNICRENTRLSRQTFCRDKRTLVATNKNKTNSDKTFVATKMVLMAAPADDTV